MLKNIPTGLAHVAIPAGDFTTTVDFYKNLGFTPVVMHEFSCILENGSCGLEIYRRRVDEKPAGAIDHIALVSEDIDAAYKEIKALGHSQTSTTLNIYAHTFAQAQAKASKAVADILDFRKTSS